jgi:hypothetical protein
MSMNSVQATSPISAQKNDLYRRGASVPDGAQDNRRPLPVAARLIDGCAPPKAQTTDGHISTYA